jgi:hypothetical protein
MREYRPFLADTLWEFCFPWTNVRYWRAMQRPPIFAEDA